METWKNRPDDVSILSVASDGQGIQMLSRREKQAVLLTFVLSDDVEESRLDAILKASLGVGE